MVQVNTTIQLIGEAYFAKTAKLMMVPRNAYLCSGNVLISIRKKEFAGHTLLYIHIVSFVPSLEHSTLQMQREKTKRGENMSESLKTTTARLTRSNRSSIYISKDLIQPGNVQ